LSFNYLKTMNNNNTANSGRKIQYRLVSAFMLICLICITAPVHAVQVRATVSDLFGSANKASAKPGELITYTVTIAHTDRSSAATVAGLSNKLSCYSAFGPNTFDAGTPLSSNLTNTSGASTLAVGAPDYASTGPVWSKPPIDGAGGAPTGYDGLVANWKVPFTGDLQVGDSFTLQYGATTK